MINWWLIASLLSKNLVSRCRYQLSILTMLKTCSWWQQPINNKWFCGIIKLPALWLGTCSVDGVHPAYRWGIDGTRKIVFNRHQPVKGWFLQEPWKQNGMNLSKLDWNQHYTPFIFTVTGRCHCCAQKGCAICYMFLGVWKTVLKT